MAQGGDANESRENASKGTSSVKIDFVDNAIDSKFYWAYSKMLMLVATVLLWITCWAQSCPCHLSEELYKLMDLSRDGLKKMFAQIWKHTCPLKGCRVPELAAGAVIEFTDKLYEIATGKLLVICMGLSSSSRNKVFHDFNRSKSKIADSLRLKTVYALQLPHKLGVLGHCVLSKAQAGFRLCKQMYACSAPGVSHHGLEYVLLDDRSPIAHECTTSLTCADGGNTPCLDLFKARFLLCSLLETSIEAKHALSTKSSNRAAALAPGGLSFELHGPEIEKTIERDSAMLQHLIEACEVVTRSPNKQLAALGLSSHPYAMRCRASEKGLRRKHIHQIVYHCDPDTLYADHKAEERKIKKAHKVSDRDEKRALAVRVLQRKALQVANGH